MTDQSRTPTVSENVRSIIELELSARDNISMAERVSKTITNGAGTMSFVLVHVVCVGGWIAWNALAPNAFRFDPFPFGLLGMIVAVEAVFLATFVLITQNRMMANSERRDHLELQVTMLAEQELTMVLRMLRQLCDQAGVPQDVEQRRVE